MPPYPEKSGNSQKGILLKPVLATTELIAMKRRMQNWNLTFKKTILIQYIGGGEEHHLQANISAINLFRDPNFTDRHV